MFTDYRERSEKKKKHDNPDVSFVQRDAAKNLTMFQVFFFHKKLFRLPGALTLCPGLTEAALQVLLMASFVFLFLRFLHEAKVTIPGFA